MLMPKRDGCRVQGSQHVQGKFFEQRSFSDPRTASVSVRQQWFRHPIGGFILFCSELSQACTHSLPHSLIHTLTFPFRFWPTAHHEFVLALLKPPGRSRWEMSVMGTGFLMGVCSYREFSHTVMVPGTVPPVQVTRM